MGQKNFGVAVSGYLDPDGRNFEQAVYQAGKPVLDKELNLAEDITSAFGLNLTRRISTSGWLTEDHLNKSDPMAGFFNVSATANTLSLVNSLRAVVNGWLVEVAYTNHNASNQLDLGAGPAGNGAKRTDLVILEVWRKLISASPSTDGKSTGARIWRNGNVKVPALDDASLNYADDILDVTVASETTKRVQIQYRLRAVSGVDLFAYPAGLDDPSVVARSVPPNVATPDGNVTAFTYTNQSANGDAGLWRAGDGNPANTLSTVDGYMYAIPLVAVFRRNTSAFNRNLNHNGGVASPGPSDRPDGLFQDIFAAKDVADLRRAVTLQGRDTYPEIAEKNFGYLLDNILKSEWGSTAIGNGVDGHTYLWADEIGVLPGDGTTTGDTPGAEFIGQFDCTRRFFSDRANCEIMTYTIAPGDPNVSTATWQTGTQVTINSAQIAQYPFPGSIGFLSRAPSGTRIIDVVRARVQGTTGGEKGLDVGMTYAMAPDLTVDPWPITSITGLAAYPAGNIIITLGAPPAGGLTTEPIYIDLLIAYPSGVGLSKTATADFGSASFVQNNPGALSAGAPVSYASVLTQTIDPVHREALLQYETSNLSFTFSADTTGPSTEYFLPERAETIVSITKNGNPAVGNVDASGRKLTLAAPTAPGDVIVVTYTGNRPFPQSGFQMTIFYEARAPQTVRSSLLGTSVTLIPRWISPHLYSITAGSGSQGEGYPYPFAYVQTGGVLKDGSPWSGEHELNGAVEIFIADFNASTGFVKVPAFIPYVPNPESVTFTRNLADTDIEGRTFLPTVPPGYAPSSFGQNLSNDRVHKVILPTLMESGADSNLGRKGSLFLVLLTRWAAFDSENSVKFLSANNTTAAAVYRVSGNMLNRRG
jgi:hypothetical protein